MWPAAAYAVDGYQEVTPGDPPNPHAGVGCDPDLLQQIRRSMGTACFFPYNDVIWLADRDEDGRSVAIQWKIVGGDRRGIIRNKLGFGNGGYVDKDFPEGGTLKWRMGQCDQSPNNDCREAGDYTAWGAGSGWEAFCISINAEGEAEICNW